MEPTNADLLILRHLAGEASTDEEAELAAWRAADPAHQHHYQQLAALWTKAGPAPTPSPVDLDAEWARLQPRLRTPAVRRRRLPRWIWSTAAAAAVLAFSVILWDTVQPDPPVVVTAAIGTQPLVPLPDGSTVRLASGSTLRYPDAYGQAERTVELEGEAFFEVEPQAMPFVVTTRAATVTVLGTTFAVQTQPTGTYLVVQEGRVRLQASASASPAVEVEAGEGRLARTGQDVEVLTNAQYAAALSWISGTLAFAQTPLAEVTRTLSRRYGTPVRLAPAADSTLTLTLRFQDEALPDIVNTLAATLGYSVTAGEDGYRLEP
ncbi:MAG: FecR domain-containing protein [Bacteroidota bacterium]